MTVHPDRCLSGDWWAIAVVCPDCGAKVGKSCQFVLDVNPIHFVHIGRSLEYQKWCDARTIVELRGEQ